MGLQNCFCRDLKQNQLYALIFKFWYVLHVQNPAITYNKLKHAAHCPNTVVDSASISSLLSVLDHSPWVSLSFPKHLQLYVLSALHSIHTYKHESLFSLLILKYTVTDGTLLLLPKKTGFLTRNRFLNQKTQSLMVIQKISGAAKFTSTKGTV